MADSSDQMSDVPEGKKDEALDWVIRLTSGDATQADLEALKRWRKESPLNEAAIVQASKLWKSVGSSVESFVRSDPKAAPFGRFAQRDIKLQRRAALGGAFAAAAAYAVVRPPFGLWPSFAELNADYRTGTGQQRRITVAGAQVELNTETSIDAWATPSGGDRIKIITGEAIITAAADTARPLVVVAANGRTTASGAVFNVRHFSASVCVTCVAGTITVEQLGQTATIQPSQQITYVDDGLGTPVKVDPSVVTAWRNGVLIFHNEPLADVIKDVNRYLPGRIILMNASLGNQLVTARFRLDRLDDVLTQVQEVFGASVTRLPGGVVLINS